MSASVRSLTRCLVSGVNGAQRTRKCALREDLVPVEALDAHRAGGGSRGLRDVVRDDAHPEPVAAPGDGLADRAEADDPERLAGQRLAFELEPPTAAHRGVDAVELAGEHDEVGGGDVGDVVAEDSGRVGHPDAQLARGVEVDAVDADAPLGDDAHARRVLEDPRGEGVVAGDHAVVVADDRDQLVLARLLEDLGQRDLDVMLDEPLPELVDAVLHLAGR